MQRAGTVRTQRRVPAIPIASDPSVCFCSQPTNAGNQKQPREQIPARKKQSDVRPGLGTAPNASARVNRLHPAHSFLAIDLREACLRGWIVQVQEFDSTARIHAPQARNAGAA